MNMLSKWKRLWTLTPKSKAGFTLVELIVVIAILAILAAVAIPAYSGYIEKAEKANDLQLLGAVNTAFAAACAANGNDVYFIDSAEIVLAGEKGNKKVDITSVYPYPDEFKVFFEGNEDAVFNVIEDIYFNKDLHVFEENTSEVIKYGDGYFRVSKETIQALEDSTYYSDDLGSETLMTQVDRVAQVAGVMGTVGNVKKTDGYNIALMGFLGLKPEDIKTGAEITETLQSKAMEKLGITGKKFNELSADESQRVLDEVNRMKDNALVLYTAQQTTTLGVDGAKDLLKDVTSQDIRNAMSEGATEDQKKMGMNQAALAYGMYYAYVNSDQAREGLTAEQKANPTAMEVIDALDNDPTFKTYMASEQGTKDMEAYLKALEVLNDGSKDQGAAGKLLTDGFASQELIDTLKGAMGGK